MSTAETDPSVFACQHEGCEETYEELEELEQHCAEDHPNGRTRRKGRKCPYPDCDTWRLKIDWFEHLVTHHQDYRYLCQDCDVAFRSRRSGYDHVKHTEFANHRATPAAWTRGFHYRQWYEKNAAYMKAREELIQLGMWNEKWPSVLPDFTQFLKIYLAAMISHTRTSSAQPDPTLASALRSVDYLGRMQVQPNPAIKLPAQAPKQFMHPHRPTHAQAVRFAPYFFPPATRHLSTISVMQNGAFASGFQLNQPFLRPDGFFLNHGMHMQPYGSQLQAQAAVSGFSLSPQMQSLWFPNPVPPAGLMSRTGHFVNLAQYSLDAGPSNLGQPAAVSGFESIFSPDFDSPFSPSLDAGSSDLGQPAMASGSTSILSPEFESPFETNSGLDFLLSPEAEQQIDQGLDFSASSSVNIDDFDFYFSEPGPASATATPWQPALGTFGNLNLESTPGSEEVNAEQHPKDQAEGELANGPHEQGEDELAKELKGMLDNFCVASGDFDLDLGSEFQLELQELEPIGVGNLAQDIQDIFESHLQPEVEQEGVEPIE
ncbi:hypothetical protein M422DRAFT_43668 [Sphaerobolus stellatus SS14]|nr:hypothetical protein M422DRAFT_43668 [Sphaerobolus stellatus SS14]